MTVVIEDLREGNKKKIDRGVIDGQIRTNHCGRVIMVITDVRFPDGSKRSQTLTLRALMLKEQTRCNGGTCIPFTTIPKEYTREEIARDYPIVLESSITLYGEEK